MYVCMYVCVLFCLCRYAGLCRDLYSNSVWWLVVAFTSHPSTVPRPVWLSAVLLQRAEPALTATQPRCVTSLAQVLVVLPGRLCWLSWRVSPSRVHSLTSQHVFDLPKRSEAHTHPVLCFVRLCSSCQSSHTSHPRLAQPQPLLSSLSVRRIVCSRRLHFVHCCRLSAGFCLL